MDDLVTRLRKVISDPSKLSVTERWTPIALLEEAIDTITKLQNSYRCYSCRQVFEEDHGHGLASQHFGSTLNGDRPKCEEILNGGASWGGGPHDPYYRVRKDVYEAKDQEIADLKAKIKTLEATNGLPA